MSSSFRKVTATHQYENKQIFQIKLINEVGEEEIIYCTSNHPFYVWGKGFVSADKLQLEAHLITQNLETITVTNVEKQTSKQMVYDLTVDLDHTYFVGKDGVWVHNSTWGSWEINLESISLAESYELGGGGYGVAYKLEGQDIVVKVISADIDDNPWAEVSRAVNILNQVNGEGYASIGRLSTGETVLVSRYIRGHAVGEQTAMAFVRSKGLRIADPEKPGNVMRGYNGKLYLIDADLVTLPEGSPDITPRSKALYDFLKEEGREDLLGRLR